MPYLSLFIYLPVRNERRRKRWFFGGSVSVFAISITHPIDIIKVQLQTQTYQRKSVSQLVQNIYYQKGIAGFYSGLSAAILRQLTYNTIRFGIYEVGKNHVDDDSSMSNKIVWATIAGLIGGLIGVPSDVVNVRMQNDAKLPREIQRGYKHVLDGFAKIIKTEGVVSLYTGWHAAVLRSIILTIGTNATYDQLKYHMEFNTGMEDKFPLHFLTSSSAGIMAVFATVLTHPLDVVKTVMMSSTNKDFSTLSYAVSQIAKGGPFAFFKGIIPSLFRVVPNTVITFLLLEQMRLYFGYLPETKDENNDHK